MRRPWLDPSFAVAIIGTAISIYLTFEHFTASTSLACPEGQVINCAKVTTSAYAAIFGIPVAVLGLAYFVGMSALTSPAAWRSRRLDVVRVVGVITGVIMVLYLIWVELFRLNAICLWCTFVHGCAVLLLGTVLWRVVGRAGEA